jgi:hypothetical protein
VLDKGTYAAANATRIWCDFAALRGQRKKGKRDTKATGEEPDSCHKSGLEDFDGCDDIVCICQEREAVREFTVGTWDIIKEHQGDVKDMMSLIRSRAAGANRRSYLICPHRIMKDMFSAMVWN